MKNICFIKENLLIDSKINSTIMILKTLFYKGLSMVYVAYL